MEIDWDMACSIVTAGAAILALLISVMQMRLSNRQQLLDRRLRIWTKAHSLMKLCKDGRSLLERKAEGPELGNGFHFQVMADSSMLCDVGPADGRALEVWNPRLLAEIEELNEMAFEAEMVFRGPAAKTLRTFIEDYASLLMSMYLYQIALRDLRGAAEERHFDLGEAISAVGEDEERAKLCEARARLLDSFDRLSPRVIEKIASQCRLSWLPDVGYLKSWILRHFGRGEAAGSSSKADAAQSPE